MKKLFIVFCIITLLTGYALMAIGSDESDSSKTQSGEAKTSESSSETESKSASQQSESASQQNEGQDDQADQNSQTEIALASAPEYPKRAAVTAMTNLFAFDSTVHRYSDKSGAWWDYYLFIISAGSWTQTGENSWRVSNMKLRNYGNSDRTTIYDYTVSMSIQEKSAEQTFVISGMTYRFDYQCIIPGEEYSLSQNGSEETHSLFTVPYSYIEQDRTGEP